MSSRHLYAYRFERYETPKARFYPNRHRRRMMARRARGLRPVSRYEWAGLVRFLPNADQKPLTRTQCLERKCKLSPMGRFQVYNWLYHSYGFGTVTVHCAFNHLGVFCHKAARCCGAPLCPD